MTDQQIRTRITSFTIQDIDGLKYKFLIHGSTKILQTNYCDKTLHQYSTQPKFKDGKVYHQAGFDNGTFANPWVIGSWYLYEIEDPLTLRKIQFTYDTTRVINNTAGSDFTYNGDKNYSIISHKTSIAKAPALLSISYPDGHNVTFNYPKNRIDLNGDKILSSVDITYQGRYLSEYKLNTSYFIRNRYGNPTTNFETQSARLCLRSVQKIGPDLKEDSPPYIFDYYIGSSAPDDFVPPPFFHMKDIWGFYNGSNSIGYSNETIPLSGDLTLLSNKIIEG